MIQAELDIRGIEPKTEIWIYPRFPLDFEAVVGVYDDKVYIFRVHRGRIISIAMEDCLGFRANGSLIY